jgi:membrane dipeptidase
MVDFPRLKKGGLRGAFWSVFVPCPTNETSFADEVYATSVHDTLQQIDLVQRLTERYPTHLRVARTAGDVRSVFRHSKTQAIASLMGIEGLHQIGNSASLLRQYYALGVRYATLTHVCHNIYADSASPSQPLHDGLSPRGREMVREMNRLGMVVDLSHTSPKTMRDALEASTAPVVFSHSNAWALHRHERNVPDDVLLQLKENGGVLMVTFVPEFLTPEPREASVKDVADVVLYVGRMIGYEHVGLGSDFDGIEYGPKGLEDVGKYGVLIRELIDRGLGLKELKGVVGDNVLRVLEAVEDVSRRMKKEGVLPLEDEVGRMFPPVVG